MGTIGVVDDGTRLRLGDDAGESSPLLNLITDILSCST
jgi:hypothetical protein